MKYSVLMSLYSGEKPENLIESIDSIVNQTIFPEQIVIVKDGLLPESLETVLSDFIKKYGDVFFIVQRVENGGLGLALRDGVSACRNDWIVRMDTDDIAVSTRVEEQMKVLSNNLELDMIGSIYYEFLPNGNRVLRGSPENHHDLIKFMHKRNPFGHDSLLIRKSKILEAGNYQNEIRFEDYGLWIRMALNGARFYNIQKPLMYVRGDFKFYARRGGILYLKRNYKFFVKYKKYGFFTRTDCIFSLLPRTIVCIIPNNARTYIYTRLLRKAGEK